MVAIGQHFVYNWRNITGKGPDGMIVDWVNWRPIFSAHFGDARNIAGAFLNNPADFLEHIGYNLRYLIHNSLVFFSETLFPDSIFRFRKN